MGPGFLVADRFSIEAAIGAGGMGTVYRARDRVSGGPVAVKLVSAADGVERFEREASVLARLEHPRIVRYVSQGSLPDGRPYLVMEWLEGEDLAARIAREPLSLAETLLLAAAVADVLGATHQRGIIHRDIKPSNLFLVGGRVETVKVLDFGIARALTGGQQLTGTGVLLGTPAYMAPEQARGESQLDARVDVFALGCVLFECLVGKPAFSGDHAVAVLAKVLLEDAPRLSELVPGVSPAFSELVERMLAKDRARRPADGAALVLALEAVRASSAQAPLASALTRAERRMVSVAITASAGTLDETLRPEERSLAERRAAQATAARGGRLSVLANGSMVAVVESGGSPTDQAVCAARVALALAHVLGSTPVALATGYASVGDRVPTGEAIDRAVRRLALGASRAPSGVRVDRATAGLLDARFRLSGEGDELYLLEESDGGEHPRTLLGRATTFVGRDRELANLCATLDEAAGDSVARAALVTAPAGVGKSRLCQELLRAARARHDDLEVLAARGDALGAGSAFGLLARMLGRAAGAADSEPADVRREKLSGRIGRHLAPDERAPTTEILLEISDAPVPDSQASEALAAARRDASVMSDAARAAFERWLDAECRAHPVLLVLEDVHWADLPSLRLVDAALRNLADRPLMVLATARPEVHSLFPGLWAERQLAELRLGPVAKRAAERFVRDTLGAPDDDTVRFVVERAAGHPFFLEELVRAIAEGRRREELPESVIGMVQARLDALGADAKRTLRAASVFGTTCWTGGVACLLGEDAATTALRFDDLVAKELLERRALSSLANEKELGFRHAVIRDAAYEMLTEADRTLGHRLAAEWLERAGGHDPAVLAAHFDLGGRPAEAARHYLRAAENALDGNDVARTLELARRALGAGASGLDEARLKLLMGEAEFWGGDLIRSEELATAAAAAFAPGSRRWYDAAALAILASGQRGENDRVEAWLDRIMPTSAEPDALAAQVHALCRGISQITYAHRRLKATEAFARVRALAPDPDGLGPMSAGWVHRVQGEMALYFRGDLHGMVLGFERATREFERARAFRNACLCRLMHASSLTFSGADDEARFQAEQALADAERLGAKFLIHFSWDIVALAHLFHGRFAEARAAAERCLAVMTGNVRIESAMRCALAMGHVDAGALEDAERESRRAIELSRGTSMQPMALAFLSFVRLAEGRLDEALAVAQDAVESERAAAGFEPFGAVTELALVRALLALGRRDDARRAAAEALVVLERSMATLPTAAQRARFLTLRLGNAELVELAAELGLEVPDPARAQGPLTGSRPT